LSTSGTVSKVLSPAGTAIATSGREGCCDRTALTAITASPASAATTGAAIASRETINSRVPTSLTGGRRSTRGTRAACTASGGQRGRSTQRAACATRTTSTTRGSTASPTLTQGLRDGCCSDRRVPTAPGRTTIAVCDRPDPTSTASATLTTSSSGATCEITSVSTSSAGACLRRARIGTAALATVAGELSPTCGSEDKGITAIAPITTVPTGAEIAAATSTAGTPVCGRSAEARTDAAAITTCTT
jgi:hypothetical protein